MDAKIADRKLRAFVLDVVNAENRQVDGSDPYLFRKHPDFFTTKDLFIQQLTTILRWEDEALNVYCRAVTQELRDRLRTVWLAGDDYTAEWRLFLLQLEMHGSLGDTQVGAYRNKEGELTAVDGPIHQAVDWVRRNLLLLRTCLSPICERPYFLPNKSQQRFCSKDCRAFGEKEHKRRWFREKGQFKRRKRQGQQAREKGRAQYPPKEQAVDQGSLQAVSPEVPTSTRTLGGRIRRREAVKVDNDADRRSKHFLEFTANATAESTKFWVRFQTFLPATSTSGQRVSILPLIGRRLIGREKLPHNGSFLSFHEEVYRRAIVEELRDRLRTIWGTEVEAVAVWRILNLQKILHEAKTADSGDQPPSLDEPTHQALHFLQRNLGKLKKCANPSCETPLFIAAKRTTSYCSGPCALFAAREYMTNQARQRRAGKQQSETG